MATVSTKTLALIRSFILCSLAYFFINDPTMVCNNRYVILVSQAMELPQVVVEDDSPLLGILALQFGVLGVSDIPPLFGDYIQFLETTIPFRLCAYFFVAIYGYFAYSPYLSNSLVFCYGFMEVVINFLMFLSLREERNEVRAVQLNRTNAAFNSEL